MKIKIWTCMITLVVTAVMIRYYAVDYGKPVEVIAEHAQEPVIRVLIKNDDYNGAFHERLEITGTEDFYREEDGERKIYPAGSVIPLKDVWKDAKTSQDDAPGAADLKEPTGKTAVWGSCKPSGELILINLKRAQEKPAYPGILEITSTEQGYLVINELSLEAYLPAVLSSEMSSSFPEEALKAQAVCARTYAIRRMQEDTDRYYGANLDDSVENQVYNNIHSDAVTKQAVNDTAGKILLDRETPADIYYYSTSCGVTEEDHFDGEEDFLDFLRKGRDSDLERQEAWYRWEAFVSSEEIRCNLQAMNLDPPKQVRKLEVVERTGNGQVTAIQIEGPDRSVRVDGEYEIRRALASRQVVLQDGSECASLSLLPSAWFVPEPQEEISEKTVFCLTGGGFGHGIGMSQNGARCMALQGSTWKEILKAYYPGLSIKTRKG